jgi:hypothetical protein
MKREELKYFYATDGEVGTMPLLTNCFVYPKEDVDHLLDEKDAEIASLKSQIAEAKELSIELQKRNKAIADNAIINVESYKSKRDAEIESLKAKLESVQASAYADSVDAGMRERRLNRALYKACANWAMNARMVEIETEPWGENHESRLWAGVYDKCLKKVEEYR